MASNHVRAEITTGTTILSAVVVAIGAAAALVFTISDTLPLLAGDLSRGQMFGRDFVQYWCASVLAWSGDVATIFDTEAFNTAFRRIMDRDLGFHAFLYPPHGLWAVLPLAWLPYEAAWLAWMLGTFALFALAVCGPMSRDGSFRHQVTSVGVLMLAPASLINISNGQNGFLSAALLIGGLRLMERQPWLAGVLFGLLSYKPQLGLLLPAVLLAGGYGRVFVGAAVTVMVLVAASLVGLGPEIWQIYLGKGAALQRTLLEHGTGIYQVMMPSFFMAGRLLHLPLAVAYAAQAVSALATLAACVIAFRRGVALDARIPLVLVGAFLVSPYGFNYDMTIVAAAVFVAVRSGLPMHPAERFALALAWLLPVIMMPLSDVGIPIGPPVLAMLFVVFWRRAMWPAGTEHLSGQGLQREGAPMQCELAISGR